MIILIALAVLIGAAGILLPLLPMFFPRIGPSLIYAMRVVRVAAIESSLLLGIVTVAIFSEQPAVYGMGVVLLVAALAQMLYPHKVIALAVDPEHVTQEQAAESRKASPEQAVLGVEIEGEACAWPVDLLLKHQVVLDHLAGKPLLLTACAASRCVRVFSAEVRGKALTFEVAGYFRRNLLLRDRESGSIWQQATGEALMGPLAGARLSPLPGAQVAWGAWQAMTPGTTLAVEWFQKHGWAPAGLVNALLLSLPQRVTPPGLTPLGGELDPHAEVAGISLRGESRAYPLAALDGSGPVRDHLGSTTIVISSDPVSGVVAAAEDSEASQPIPFLRMWWLGWKEFHPASDVYHDGISS
jgi:hypothetical protein